MVRDLLRAVVRCVADRDTSLAGRIEIDMVETNAGAHDDAAAGEPVNESLVDLHLVLDDQGVGSG